MRISDWSSDVCSSDLIARQARVARERQSLRTAKALFEASGKPATGFDELVSAKDGELTTQARTMLAQWPALQQRYAQDEDVVKIRDKEIRTKQRSEEHTSELQSLMRISYAVFCLTKTQEVSFPLHTTFS